MQPHVGIVAAIPLTIVVEVVELLEPMIYACVTRPRLPVTLLQVGEAPEPYPCVSSRSLHHCLVIV